MPENDSSSAPAPKGRIISSRLAATPTRGVKTQRQRSAGKSGKGQKGAKSKGARRSRTAQLERPTGIHTIPQPKVGFPIWIKFAIPTALIISALLLFEGILISDRTVKDLEDQINKRGVDLVTMLGQSAPREFWAKVKPPDLVEPIPEEQIVAHSQKVRDQLREQWGARLKELSDSSKQASEEGRREIIAAFIVDYDRTKTEARMRAGSDQDRSEAPRELSTSGPPTRKADVEIFKGELDGTAVREFRKPIKYEGEHIENELTPSYFGWASVFLDARSIEEIRTRTRYNIFIITLLGAIASIFVIVLIAAILTRPIRQLQTDIAIVAQGDLNHTTTRRSNDEIGALASIFDVMTRNLKAAQAHEADRKAIERELSIANEIQTKLLPERIPQIPGFDIHRYYASAKEVGGDYYDFLVIDQRHLGIVVADVSGKGIPGSMVMTMVRSLLRLASVRNFSPGDTFKKVNRILAKDIRRGMFVTAIYMVLDIVEKRLKVASAGHNPLVVYRADAKRVELVKPKGIALGFDKGPIFDSNIREVEIELRPGDRITAYTDGVNEAMNDREEEFGDERFYELVRKNAALNSQDFTNKVVQALREHQGEAEQSDDITLATLAVMR